MATHPTRMAAGVVHPGILGWMPRLVLFWALCATAGAAPAPSPTAPKAQVIRVDRTYLHPDTVSMPGAGVRTFRNPATEAGGTERFDIRWHAHPPGIPAGCVVMLESIQEHSPTVQNRVEPIRTRAEGLMHSVVEIPPDDIRRLGRVLQWRVSLVWRGRILDRRASLNWGS